MTSNSLEIIYNNLFSALQNIKITKITGEIISNKISDRHSYITLKNGELQLSCIGWNKNYTEIKNGTTVEISGILGIFKKNFSVYFNVKDIKVIGTGIYLNSHCELRQKIIDLGWINNKKKLSKFPQNIGIITSLEGAAVQDILQALRLDNFIGNVFIKHAIVQGAKCPQSVINAIEYFEKSNFNIDLLVITRGGGSYTDLEGFSDWNVLEKIHNTNFITFSAIGHQIDNQLSDEVADYKFATPSLGAKFIAETQKSYYNLLETIKCKLKVYNDLIINSKNKLDTIKVNYQNIIHSYDKKEQLDTLSKYKDFIHKIQNKWTMTKTNFYNKLSNVKPTIYKNDGIELSTITEFINPITLKEITPKKIEIIFADGIVKLYYRIIDYEFRQ